MKTTSAAGRSQSDSSPATAAGVTCHQQQQDNSNFSTSNFSTSNCSLRRLSSITSVSSVSTPTVCTLVPVTNIRQSAVSTNGQISAPAAAATAAPPNSCTIDHYQSVTPLPQPQPPPPPPPPPPLPPHPRLQTAEHLNDLQGTAQKMLVPTLAESGTKAQSGSVQSFAKEMDKSRTRQRLPPSAISARQVQPVTSAFDQECCSCRSIVTEPGHFNNDQQHVNSTSEKQPNEEKKEEAESNQFIFYLLLKKLFSIFRRRRKKDRGKKRRGNPETAEGNKWQTAGGKVRRSGSVYSRCSISSRKPIKLSGHCRFDQNVTFVRLPNQRYGSGIQTKPLLVDDCEECRREAQLRRPPSRRGSRRLRRQSSAVERFARQHRLIMSMLGRQRFGVSKMFEQLNSRCKDYRPNYQFLNQLLYQGVIRNRMSGYRYNLIRPILADVPEDEEQSSPQHASSATRAKSRQRQNRHFQPPPPPVPPSSVHNCCGESVYARQPPPPLRPRGLVNGGQPPVIRAHSKVSSLGYGRLNNNHTANDRASKRSGPPPPPSSTAARQSRLVQAPTATDCIDCIITQLKSRPRAPSSACTCCDCQTSSNRGSHHEEPAYKCSEFYPLLSSQLSSTARRTTAGGQSAASGRNMSTRRRKMMCKKFDSMIVEESFQCHSQQVSVTRAEQHYGGAAQCVSSSAGPEGLLNGSSLYASKGLRKSGRSSLPTSSSSECSSSASSRTSKYLQQCTCCLGRGSAVAPSRQNTASKGHRHFAASQFTAPKVSHHSSGPTCSASIMPTQTASPHSACFCPGCIATHNMTVAKL